jgi:hypothetical protein
MGLKKKKKKAKANEVAIQNEILKLPGVKYSRIYSNRGIIEINGRPPKSFEAVVVGGDEQEIAETIFENGPAGIQAFGKILKDVIDSEGSHWEIGFSRPVNKYIWISINYSRNYEEDLPMDVVAAVQDSIIKWGQKTLGVGVDLMYQRIFRHDVQGIGKVKIKVAVTDDLTPPLPESYVNENVIIGDVEIAVLDISRIFVKEVVW